MLGHYTTGPCGPGKPTVQARRSRAGVPGLEPRLTEPESVVLPITPYPMGVRAPVGAGPVPPQNCTGARWPFPNQLWGGTDPSRAGSSARVRTTGTSPAPAPCRAGPARHRSARHPGRRGRRRPAHRRRRRPPRARRRAARTRAGTAAVGLADADDVEPDDRSHIPRQPDGFELDLLVAGQHVRHRDHGQPGGTDGDEQRERVRTGPPRVPECVLVRVLPALRGRVVQRGTGEGLVQVRGTPPALGLEVDLAPRIGPKVPTQGPAPTAGTAASRLSAFAGAAARSRRRP